MSRLTFQGSEGVIKGYAFHLFGKKWIAVVSETKWHSGERFKKAPIWGSNIRGNTPSLFIGKFAIGYRQIATKKEKNKK